MDTHTKIDYYSILYNAKKFVPLLSENDIKKIVIQAIFDYLKTTISILTLVKVALLIKKYYPGTLSNDLNNDLEEISSMYVVEEVLAEILHEMTITKKV